VPTRASSTLTPGRTAVLLALLLAPALAEQTIVYTAHQNFDSRIYLMRMDGSVRAYHEYAFYYMADLATVGNDVHVAEAFAPRSYRVNLETGDLELIIDDWNLFYFYGLAWDGNWLYVDEWDLTRYDSTGAYQGRAGFDEAVMGAACDSAHLWTIDDTGNIRCWDKDSWPDVTEVPENAFAAPTIWCRGLWFDGECFWTAESRDGQFGWIYRFDRTGAVQDSWREPAFNGWSACVVDLVGLEEEAASPIPRLDSPQPSPFRARTTIELAAPRRERLLVTVHNSLGRNVCCLLNGIVEPGRTSLTWHGADDSGRRLPAGIYTVRLRASSGTRTQPVVLLK
jgi:hypothetical protein